MTEFAPPTTDHKPFISAQHPEMICFVPKNTQKVTIETLPQGVQLEL